MCARPPAETVLYRHKGRSRCPRTKGAATDFSALRAESQAAEKSISLECSRRALRYGIKPEAMMPVVPRSQVEDTGLGIREGLSEGIFPVYFFDEFHLFPKPTGHDPAKKIILVCNCCLGRLPPDNPARYAFKLWIDDL